MAQTLATENPGVTGLKSVIEGFNRLESVIKRGCTRGLESSLALVLSSSKEILTTKLYEKDDRPEYYPEFTQELYNSFVQEIMKIGGTAIFGETYNTSEHASYFEYGTGAHVVAPVNVSALRWIGKDAEGNVGEMFDSKPEGHIVSGVEPIRFMEDSIKQNKISIIGIFNEQLQLEIKKEFG